jgi:hypothetical protein
MNRILTTLAAATAVVGVASVIPTQASAQWQVAPVVGALIIGGAAVGGVAVGAAVANEHPQGRVMVSDAQPEPAPGPAPGPIASAAPPDRFPGCYPSRAKLHGVWHDIEVCD